MAGLWQRTGNVTVTNGSKTVTGFGTKWKTGTLPIQKGHTFYGPDNFAYEVDTVVSDESLTLVEAYRGSTLANQAYRIDITRTSTISQIAADLASLVAKYRTWFVGMMTWLTGSGDVSILNPDTGANTTIPSWKKVASEGEGQAARAKIEADKATAAAALSVNAVREAAVPFPDVWAPLNDSLRMFAGYGREAKVGDDVVARYVDFSRATTATFIDKSGSLRVAAVNEPRFEKEGLLIEGASTNLATYSEEPNRWSFLGVTKVENTDKSLTITSTSPGYPRLNLVASSTINLEAGDAMTATYWLKPEGAPIIHLTIDVAGGLATLRATVDRATLAVSKFPAGASIGATAVTAKMECGLIKIVMTLNVTAAATFGGSFVGPVAAGGSPAAAGTGESTTVVRGQLEKLPFATSYIPTQAAAATRAADLVSIPSARNINPTNTDVTYAMQVEFRGVQVRPFRTDGSISSSGAVISASGQAWFFSDAATTAPKSSNMAVVGMNDFVANNNAAGVLVCINGVLGGARTPSRGAAETNASALFIGVGHTLADPINGHIRNFRIWHQSITDAQLKAIR